MCMIHKWCYKLFVFSVISGYSYNFVNNIAQNEQYSVYLNNYYTAIPLLHQLTECEILELGTMGRNRILNGPLASKQLKKRHIVVKVKNFLTEMVGVFV